MTLIFPMIQMKYLAPSSLPDSYVREMELALGYNSKQQIAIYPLLVGETDDTGRFIKFDGHMSGLPRISTAASPTSSQSVKATLQAIFKFGGIWMNDAEPSQAEITAIVKWCDKFAWGTTHKQSLEQIARWSAPNDTLDFLFNLTEGRSQSDADSMLSTAVFAWFKDVIGLFTHDSNFG